MLDFSLFEESIDRLVAATLTQTTLSYMQANPSMSYIDASAYVNAQYRTAITFVRQDRGVKP